MKKLSAFRNLATGLLLMACGCQTGDPAPRMIAFVDSRPPEKRPPNWEQTKTLMLRPAPAVGENAPDFTLKELNGTESVTLSEFHPGRPCVLIFGSYT